MTTFAPANLPELVRTAFTKARAAGDLLFFPTQVALLRVNGRPFQLRYAPSLAKKPKGEVKGGEGKEEEPAESETFKTVSGESNPTKSGTSSGSKSASGTPIKSDTSSGNKSATGGPKFDPFAAPVPNLLVVPNLGPSHKLVLNKFAICQEHSILATTDFKQQNNLLEEADLAAAYACIEAYGEAGEELFVFYNSGQHSGASQPHRHLQMLPVERMREGVSGWSVLVDSLTIPEGLKDVLGDVSEGDGDSGAGDASGSVSKDASGVGDPLSEPPIFIATALLRAGGPPPPPSHLYTTYLQLYRQACAAADADDADDPADEQKFKDEEDGKAPARISYNLALTRQTMALCPRLKDGAEVVATAGKTPDKIGDKSTRDSGRPMVSLNGTLLAGTALVKNEPEWDALRKDPAALTRILGQVGVPLGSDTQEMAFL